MSWITFFFVLSCFYQHSESLAGIDIRDCGLFERLQISSGSTRMNYEQQGALPWMVRVRYARSNNVFQFKCVGVIITSQWVLSGGLCIEGQPGRDRVTVFPGEVQSVGTGQSDITGNISSPADYWYHSPVTWGQNGQRLDVGLIHLATPIPMGNNQTHFLTNGICLPNIGDTPDVGLNYTLAGYYIPMGGSNETLVRSRWGQIILSNNCPSRARQLLEQHGRDFSEDQYSVSVRDGNMSETVFCANFIDPHPNNDEGNRNPPWTCLLGIPNDVGSPLMIQQLNGRWMLVGTNIGEVRNRGQPLPNTYCGFYGLYVNVYSILDWIEQTIQNHGQSPSPGTTTTAPGPSPGTNPSPLPPGPGPNPSPQPPSNETGTDVVPPNGGSPTSETGSNGNYLVYIALLAIILFLALVGVCLFAYFKGASKKSAEPVSYHVEAERPIEAAQGKQPSPEAGNPHEPQLTGTVRSDFNAKQPKAEGCKSKEFSESQLTIRSQ